MKQLKQFYVFDPEDVLINHFETYKEAKEFSENKKHAHIHYSTTLKTIITKVYIIFVKILNYTNCPII